MSSQGLEMPVAVPKAATPPTGTAATADTAGQGVASAEVRRPLVAGRTAFRLTPFVLVAAAAVALAVHKLLPSHQTQNPTRLYPRFLIGVMVAGAIIGLTQQFWRPMKPTLRRLPVAAVSNFLHWCVVSAPILAGGVLLLCAWDLITLKLALMPLPYFPGPDAVFQTLVDDWASAGAGQPGLLECMTHSLVLLLSGYLVGCVVGIAWGVLIGWFAGVRYWGMPVMKVIGPVPATALIPMSLMLFRSPFASAVALIALAVWFPVTILTLSGVANTRTSYLDVARTLGARPGYLVLRVAFPAALPNIFVGLFMGLGASFLTLVVAEGVGVQAGLGWYIDWARAYSDYSKVYAALIIMSAYFSTIMTLLFKLRDWVLVWQKGVIKW